MAANLMKYCSSFALMLLCIFSDAAWAQVLSDPTRPPSGIGDAAASAGVPVYPQVRGLQSVIISPSRCAAIIDGKTVELGAKHGSEKLVDVTEKGVVLQGEHGRRVLTLFSAVSMKITETLPLDKRAVKCKPAKQAGQKEKK